MRADATGMTRLSGHEQSQLLLARARSAASPSSCARAIDRADDIT